MSHLDKTEPSHQKSNLDWYSFGEKSMGLIAVLLKSDGTIKVFASHRPAFDRPMQYLYKGETQAKPGVEVAFTLSVAGDKVGLLTTEQLCWPFPYEQHRVHMLGIFNPFRADEIKYQDEFLNGKNRDGNIPANRKFRCQFLYNPKAPQHFDRAILTLTDVDSNNPTSGPTGRDIIYVPAMDAFDSTGNVSDPGGIIVAVRVNQANYTAACATLQFDLGMTLDIVSTDGTKYPGLSKILLNQNQSPI